MASSQELAEQARLDIADQAAAAHREIDARLDQALAAVPARSAAALEYAARDAALEMDILEGCSRHPLPPPTLLDRIFRR